MVGGRLIAEDIITDSNNSIADSHRSVKYGIASYIGIVAVVAALKGD